MLTDVALMVSCSVDGDPSLTARSPRSTPIWPLVLCESLARAPLATKLRQSRNTGFPPAVTSTHDAHCRLIQRLIPAVSPTRSGRPCPALPSSTTDDRLSYDFGIH